MKPPPKNAKITGLDNEPAEIRKLREQAEAIARDVANLHGRLDVIEAFLKFNINSWKPT